MNLFDILQVQNASFRDFIIDNIDVRCFIVSNI